MAPFSVATWTRLAALAVVAIAAGGCQSTVRGPGSAVETLTGGDDTAWWQGDGIVGGPGADPGTQQGGPSAEVCDGLDNDLDGQIDEGTDGGPCTGPSGGAGTERCIAGKLVCQECTPGDTRTHACGCGIDATDKCNDAGRWVTAVCDGCTVEPPSCGDDAECKPGDERIQRCDTCAPGQTCGTSCIGALWRCTSGCKWSQITQCQARDPQCDRDTSLVQECGKCGRQDVKCDGCFWVPGACHDQGSCMPGDTRDTPCFSGGNACTAGYVATTVCNDKCSWEPGSCDGCTPGAPEDVDIDCVQDHPECGKRIERHQCIGSRTVNSCMAQPLTEGVYTTTTILDECANVVRPNFCTPNQVTTQTVSCGAGSCGLSLTITTTCSANGCGSTDVTSGSCGSCTSGQTETQDCTTGGGACGSQTRSCTGSCDWGAWSSCVPYVNQPCQQGATEERACTAACNKPGTSTWQCAGGCGGWQQISQCESNQVQCNPGDVQDLGLCPNCPTTHKTQSCDAQSCSWVQSTCPICG